MNGLTIALPKGRLLEAALTALRRSGVESLAGETSRRLIFTTNRRDIHLVVMRPSDVPTYVEYGAADLGITGKDVLLEQLRNVYELLDLHFGECRFVLAGPRPGIGKTGRFAGQLRVATKFPNIAAAYFRQRGTAAEIIKLNGAVELAPNVGLADMIVDIVSTGQTLAANNLEIIDEIFTTTARLIANRASYRLKTAALQPLLEALRQGAEGRGDGEVMDR